MIDIFVCKREYWGRDKMAVILHTTFQRHFNGNVWLSIKFSLKFLLKGPISNIPALVKIMIWCRTGDKPLSQPTMVILSTHICVTWAQRVDMHRNATERVYNIYPVWISNKLWSQFKQFSATIYNIKKRVNHEPLINSRVIIMMIDYVIYMQKYQIAHEQMYQSS